MTEKNLLQPVVCSPAALMGWNYQTAENNVLSRAAVIVFSFRARAAKIRRRTTKAKRRPKIIRKTAENWLKTCLTASGQSTGARRRNGEQTRRFIQFHSRQEEIASKLARPANNRPRARVKIQRRNRLSSLFSGLAVRRHRGAFAFGEHGLSEGRRPPSLSFFFFSLFHLSDHRGREP